MPGSRRHPTDFNQSVEPVPAPAAIACLLTGLWTLESLLGNVWLLQGRPFGVMTALPAISLAAFSGSAVLWILTSGTRTGRGGRGLIQAIVIAVATLLLAITLITLLGGAMSRGLPHYEFALNHLAQHVLGLPTHQYT